MWFAKMVWFAIVWAMTICCKGSHGKYEGRSADLFVGASSGGLGNTNNLIIKVQIDKILFTQRFVTNFSFLSDQYKDDETPQDAQFFSLVTQTSG